ncbi:MAG: HEAT repeat domain-containing protein, partial [Planctomycetes bacterium]|nr:HEAT repeat domain-containing protein [Planctomycetota bacterium]
MVIRPGLLALTLCLLPCALLAQQDGGDLESIVSRCTQDLQGAEVVTRRKAVRLLENLGEKASAAAPALVEALRDPDAEVSEGAAAALNRMPASKSTVQGVLAVLSHPAAPARAAALKLLGHLRPAESEAIESISAAVKDPDAEVRFFALKALGCIGPRARSAAPALLSALCDERMAVAFAAAGALVVIGAGPDQVIPEFLKLLGRTPEDRARSELHSLIRRIGSPAVPPLIEALRSPETLVRMEAAGVLPGLMAPPETPRADASLAIAPFLPELIRAMDDPEPKVRQAVIDTMAALGHRVPEASFGLARALRDPDAEFRARAARALGPFGAEAKDSLPALLATLRDPSVEVRTAVLESLVRIGPDPSDAPRLAEALALGLHDDRWEVRRATVDILVAMMGGADATGWGRGGRFPRATAQTAMALSAPEEFAPLLVEALIEPELGVTLEATDALIRMHQGAAGVFPLLTEALEVADPRVRVSSALVLARAGEPLPPGVVLTLASALASPDAEWRTRALQAIRNLGAGAVRAIPALVEGLAGDDPALSEECGELLLKSGSPGTQAVEKELEGSDRLRVLRVAAGVVRPQSLLPGLIPALLRGLDDPDPGRRLGCIRVLCRVGKSAGVALPRMTDLAQDPDRAVREAAVRVILNSSPGEPAAIPALLQVLRSDDTSVAVEAARVLGSMGPSAEVAIPALVE